jgi:predicted nucleic acid-binding protein
VEVSGALVRAARTGRGDEQGLLALLDADLGPEGTITVVTAAQEDIEMRALALVRTHGLRAMDAWHLAVAEIAISELIEPGETAAFASRDRAQTQVAKTLGFQAV